MTKEISTLRKYRVLYAVTRAEYYEIEAANETEAEDAAFGDGCLVLVGDTTDVTDYEVVEIDAFDQLTLIKMAEDKAANDSIALIWVLINKRL